MKIKDINWAVPTNKNKDRLLKEWKAQFCEIEQSNRHWRVGRSAHSLADFFIYHHGEDRIKAEVNKVLVQDPIIELMEAEIECKCPFDDYRNARRQDMGIVGKTKNGKKVFIGVEAKVDEPFGPTVGKALQEAEAYVRQHPRSKRVTRIIELCGKFDVKPEDEGMSDLRYQLFHFAAGTASVPRNGCDWISRCGGIDDHVMMTLVFKTGEYSEDKGLANKKDYDRFLELFFKDGRLKKVGFPACPVAIYCEIPL